MLSALDWDRFGFETKPGLVALCSWQIHVSSHSVTNKMLAYTNKLSLLYILSY